MSNNRSYEKGTQDNPYTLEEYNNLYNREEWPGGYVLINDEVLYKGPHMNQDDEEGSGCGCGCGCDEGCGCGCGSDTEEGSHPLTTQYMISAGEEPKFILNNPVTEISISWTTGIAVQMFFSAGANVDGFESLISILPVTMRNEYELISDSWESRCEWTDTPYKAKLYATYKYRLKDLYGNVNNVSDESINTGYIEPIEYTIPEIYYLDEGDGCK